MSIDNYFCSFYNDLTNTYFVPEIGVKKYVILPLLSSFSSWGDRLTGNSGSLILVGIIKLLGNLLLKYHFRLGISCKNSVKCALLLNLASEHICGIIHFLFISVGRSLRRTGPCLLMRCTSLTRVLNTSK